MANLNDSQLTVIVKDNILKISSTSFVYENYWLSFHGAVFKVIDYISESITENRTRFFQNRDYAVFLLIGLDKLGNLTVVEGTQVKYNGVVEQVPLPVTFSIMPLVGLVVIQDGSNAYPVKT